MNEQSPDLGFSSARTRRDVLRTSGGGRARRDGRRPLAAFQRRTAPPPPLPRPLRGPSYHPPLPLPSSTSHPPRFDQFVKDWGSRSGSTSPSTTSTTPRCPPASPPRSRPARVTTSSSTSRRCRSSSRACWTSPTSPTEADNRYGEQSGALPQVQLQPDHRQVLRLLARLGARPGRLPRSLWEAVGLPDGPRPGTTCSRAAPRSSDQGRPDGHRDVPGDRLQHGRPGAAVVVRRLDPGRERARSSSTPPRPSPRSSS